MRTLAVVNLKGGIIGSGSQGVPIILGNETIRPAPRSGTSSAEPTAAPAPEAAPTSGQGWLGGLVDRLSRLVGK